MLQREITSHDGDFSSFGSHYYYTSLTRSFFRALRTERLLSGPSHTQTHYYSAARAISSLRSRAWLCRSYTERIRCAPADLSSQLLFLRCGCCCAAALCDGQRDRNGSRHDLVAPELCCKARRSAERSHNYSTSILALDF